GPGLPGSLVVGVNAAKGVCIAYDLPLIGVNHLEGHLYAHWLAGVPPSTHPITQQEFPLLGLIVSGGHTDLVLVRGHGAYELIGHTVDDAAGEAFDKVARMLALGYPGGPAIERAAALGNPRRFKFSRPRLDRPFDFSFSGAKTAALYLVRDFGGVVDGKPGPRVPIHDIAASFQEAVVDWLVDKTVRAAQQYQVKAVLVGGGVSANRLLRERMMAALPGPVFFPPVSLCTDNAAMIGAAAHFAYLRGVRDELDMDVEPDLKIG
ncbi:MAG: tRNA (adenosine(37)-N6)-threonylcarbamoyltransferase complex transferase subunit TsaD, partial [Anaerolineae bacterium]|nr:tRNA (adenosine(37)-N6)-threonylcarbamoyltransferase complex transferase subunit TsaD [Thermoflexales bacterium]MDW8408647.1 tRNA (adenosine(37)-N6)-threonylcarbamoyltransferase complex transferase subunit TsaD [Anaerolineae bacterium]